MHTDDKGHCTRAGYAVWALEAALATVSHVDTYTDREIASYMKAASTQEAYEAEIEACG